MKFLLLLSLLNIVPLYGMDSPFERIQKKGLHKEFDNRRTSQALAEKNCREKNEDVSKQLSDKAR